MRPHITSRPPVDDAEHPVLPNGFKLATGSLRVTPRSPEAMTDGIRAKSSRKTRPY